MLEAKKLIKNFNQNVRAVREVSFSLSRAETLGLVGESGCGKSTLAKLVTRLLDADSGEVIFKGERVTGLHGRKLRDFRQKVQIIFQNPLSSFDPRLTVGQCLAEPYRIDGEKNRSQLGDHAERLLRSVDLPSALMDRLAHELSGGECQRLAIARALSRDPEVLVCDEPVSSLDLLARARILNLFLKLQKDRGISLLFISHDLRVVRHLCDRVLVMKDGQICEDGQMSQVFEKPQHRYTKELLFSSGLAPEA